MGGDLRSQIWYLFLVGAREQGCQGQPLDREVGSWMWISQVSSLTLSSLGIQSLNLGGRVCMCSHLKPTGAIKAR